MIENGVVDGTRQLHAAAAGGGHAPAVVEGVELVGAVVDLACAWHLQKVCQRWLSEDCGE